MIEVAGDNAYHTAYDGLLAADAALVSATRDLSDALNGQMLVLRYSGSTYSLPVAVRATMPASTR